MGSNEQKERDAKARANVEKLRKEKRKAEGQDQMSRELANDLNLIQRQHGYNGDRGWF